MDPSKPFKDTVQTRLNRDPAFRQALLSEVLAGLEPISELFPEIADPPPEPFGLGTGSVVPKAKKPGSPPARG